MTSEGKDCRLPTAFLSYKCLHIFCLAGDEDKTDMTVLRKPGLKSAMKEATVSQQQLQEAAGEACSSS